MLVYFERTDPPAESIPQLYVVEPRITNHNLPLRALQSVDNNTLHPQTLEPDEGKKLQKLSPGKERET